MGHGNSGGSGYGVPHARSAHDESRGAAVFALMKSWAAGIVVLVGGSYALGALFTQPEQTFTWGRLDSFGWRVILLHLPTALLAGLATFAAARLHRDPFRSSPAQHLLAALAVPLISHIGFLAFAWGVVSGEGILMSSLAVLVGCVAGMAGDMVLDARDT